VQTVYINYSDTTKPPLHGKVLFSHSFIPALILGGQEEARFLVYGRTLSCKKYRTKKDRNRS
ncbi:hypothetical protein Ancab_002612, partial [Ancistrocladus abbreviatus]